MKNEELDLDQLDAVVGGGCCPCPNGKPGCCNCNTRNTTTKRQRTTRQDGCCPCN